MISDEQKEHEAGVGSCHKTIRYAFDTLDKDLKRTFFVYCSSGVEDATKILLQVISKETQILATRLSGFLNGNELSNPDPIDAPSRPEDVRPSGRQYQAPTEPIP